MMLRNVSFNEIFVKFAGVAQGVITGIRGLCNGLGPALFGLIFFMFDVDINDHPVPETAASGSISMMLAAKNITGRMSYENNIWPIYDRVCYFNFFVFLARISDFCNAPIFNSPRSEDV